MTWHDYGILWLLGVAVLAVEWCVLEMLRNDPVDHTFRRGRSE